MAVAVFALCLALSGSALAEPIATGAATVAQTAKRALGLGKKANKRSKTALRTARTALARAGTPGPQGPQGLPGPPGPPGPPGSDAQFNGAAAGGDLTGTYPDPEIAASAVSSDEIANGSITGNDLGNLAVMNHNISPGAVTGSKLGAATIRTSSVVVPAEGSVEGNGAYETRGTNVSCAANEKVIAAGTDWDYADGALPNDQEVTTTNIEIVVGSVFQSVRARGGNDTNQDHTFIVQALCLAP